MSYNVQFSCRLRFSDLLCALNENVGVAIGFKLGMNFQLMYIYCFKIPYLYKTYDLRDMSAIAGAQKVSVKSVGSLTELLSDGCYS